MTMAFGFPLDHSIQRRHAATLEIHQWLLYGSVGVLRHILTSALCRKYWYFDCCCARCSDTTELGSHMSSLVCGRCRQGNTAWAGL